MVKAQTLIDNPSKSQRRMCYIDNIRTVLCILIVWFHSARAYADWWCVVFDYSETSPFITPYLSLILGFNMNIFLAIAGYFTPISYERNNIKNFHRKRIIRFLSPLLLFAIAMPFVMYYNHLVTRSAESISFFAYFVRYYLGIGGKPLGWTERTWPDLNFGTMWFTEYLLIFGIIYSIGYEIRKRIQNKNVSSILTSDLDLSVENCSESEKSSNSNSILPVQSNSTQNTKSPQINYNKPTSKFPRLYQILLFILVLATCTYVIRIWHRISEWTTFLLVIQVTYAHVLNYIVFFIVGIYMYRKRWLHNIPKQMGKAWFIIGMGCVVIAYIVNYYIPIGETWVFSGGTFASFLYSLWETILAVSMLIGLIYVFQTYFNKETVFTKFLANHTYMVYIVHGGIVIVLQRLFASFAFGPIISWIVVASLSTVISFGLAYILRLIPILKKYF